MLSQERPVVIMIRIVLYLVFIVSRININFHITNKYAKHSTLFWRDVAGRTAERHVLTYVTRRVARIK